jgi:hypothetical protein
METFIMKRINKIVNRKKEGYKETPRRLQKILPVVLMLQNYKKYSPEEIMERLSFISGNNGKFLLDDIQKQELIDYLKRWGYSGEWLNG